jgi:hypothetical protein
MIINALHRYTEHYALNSNCHTEKVGPDAMYTVCFSQNNIENIRLYKCHILIKFTTIVTVFTM